MISWVMSRARPGTVGPGPSALADGALAAISGMDFNSPEVRPLQRIDRSRLPGTERGGPSTASAVRRSKAGARSCERNSRKERS
jgi:hypothetical protein